MVTAAPQAPTPQAPTPEAPTAVTRPPATPTPPYLWPTRDRLAPPPTVTSPSQVDDGAYLYWLYCIPCHGDLGQGLTDEWRAEYPEEEQYCWNSGCHGKNPPEPYGFLIPTVVPPVVTHFGGLERFDTLGEIYYYVRGAMPLEMPGRLTDEEYLAIVAFLAHEMELWDGRIYDENNVKQIRLRPESAPPPTATPAAPPQEVAVPSGSQDWGATAVAGFIIILFAGGAILWRRQKR